MNNNNSEKLVNRVKELASFGRAGNEGLFLISKVRDLNNYVYTNEIYSFELLIIHTNSFLYDYIFRTDTKTHSFFKKNFNPASKEEYKFTRNIILKKKKLLMEQKFIYHETDKFITYAFNTEIDIILETEVKELNSNFLKILPKKIIINKGEFLKFVSETIECFIDEFLKNTDTIIHEEQKCIDQQEKKKIEYLIKVLQKESLKIGYIEYIKKEVIYNDSDYYDLIYFCYLLNHIQSDYNLSIDQVILLLKKVVTNEVSNPYVGNAYYSMKDSYDKTVNPELVTYIGSFDYYDLCESEKNSLQEYMINYRVRTENITRRDLYKNYYVMDLVFEIENLVYL